MFAWRLVFAGDGVADHCALRRAQPFGIGRFLREITQDQEPGDHRRNAFEDEQPLPVGQAADPHHATHDEPGQWAADDAGNGEGGHEHAVDLGPLRRWKPVGEIQHHARKEACFKGPE
ncbi:hypothetical protein D3C86_1815260 [compost metagenome]